MNFFCEKFVPKSENRYCGLTAGCQRNSSSVRVCKAFQASVQAPGPPPQVSLHAAPMAVIVLAVDSRPNRCPAFTRTLLQRSHSTTTHGHSFSRGSSSLTCKQTIRFAWSACEMLCKGHSPRGSLFAGDVDCSASHQRSW